MDHVWVALLRGINLGARNRVPMAKLREVFADAGCEDVTTYIQSGNVVFAKRVSDRAALARRLEKAIRGAFDVSAPVVLRTADELRKMVASHPFGRDTSHTVVTFLAEKPDRAAVRRLKALDVAPDRVGSSEATSTCTIRRASRARGSPAQSSSERWASPARRATGEPWRGSRSCRRRSGRRGSNPHN